MNWASLWELLGFFVLLLGLASPLGEFVARVARIEGTAARWAQPVENFFYRMAGVDPDHEMSWQEYAFNLVVFSSLGILFLYLLQRGQGFLPLNPEELPAVAPDSAFNTAISFVTNTNWQGYAGELSLSYLTQMIGLTVQNFLSAACGMAVLFALMRALTRTNTSTIGNFWVDLTRCLLYLFLPLASLLAVILVSQGVVQSFTSSVPVQPLQAHGHPISIEPTVPETDIQRIPLGPVASQVAIRQIGTNGGGYFRVNAAHPFENPTPLTNFVEMLSILLLPLAQCFAFGRLVGDLRQAYTFIGAMSVIFLSLTIVELVLEQMGNPALSALEIDDQVSIFQSGGNMEGKETRFGITASSIWAVATTAASNGSVNAMLDSFTPLGGMLPLCLIQTGEVIFGGVGSGLCGMLVFAMVAVFIAGLMIGRTPEYLGKKIEAFEMKMAALVILVPPSLALLGTALSVMLPVGRSGIGNPGPHGFSEILYAFSSAGNNNGSAFSGLTANGPYFNISLGIIMFLGRFWVTIPILAIAGSLAQKKIIPQGPGTLPTHTPLFSVLLLVTLLIVGALGFLPALALGPVVEQLMLVNR